jgi:undecaprenyl-diphosphatase
MNIFDGLILGLVQGITEFLPVSSSGHLIFVRDLLNIELLNPLYFDALVHVATAIAVLIYFWKDVFSMCKKDGVGRKYLLPIVLGLLPVAVIGLLFEDWIDANIRSTLVVAIGLIVGGLVMLWGEKRYVGESSITPHKGLVIGLFQVFALIPGMSRSGMTISGGLFAGMSRTESVRFSFLLSLPLLFGLGIKKLFDVTSAGLFQTDITLIVGVVTAFLTGLFAIHFLMKFVERHTFTPFVWYRCVLGVLIILFLV